MHEGSTGAGAANGALVATFSLLDDAESLYRAQLPDLSVDVHVQVSSTGSANGNGNSKKDQRRRSVDFVHDTIVHGTNCFTAALLPGTGSLYDLGEQPSEWIKSLEAQFECSTVLACNSTTIPSGALDAWLDEAIARVQRGVTAGGARRPRPSV